MNCYPSFNVKMFVEESSSASIVILFVIIKIYIGFPALNLKRTLLIKPTLYSYLDNMKLTVYLYPISERKIIDVSMTQIKFFDWLLISYLKQVVIIFLNRLVF